MTPPRLILASGSPRRRELLHAAGYEFVVHPADVDEDDVPPGILPADLIVFLAVKKARAVAAIFPGDVVLGADTVVAVGDKHLGKPRDAAHAAEMIGTLSGTTHTVVTGVCVVAGGVESSTQVTSTVSMRPLSADVIRDYVATNDWQGKAGGYGIQDDRPDPFVTQQSGSLTNIVGLPMEKTTEMLAAAGIQSKAKSEI